MKHSRQISILMGILVSLTLIAKGEPPKNVVLILADDLGWADTTLYGQTSLYETPNIERLAARGMTFSRAYASPICSPTRASIMTGQNPARNGMTAPAGHLQTERFQAVAAENGPPHQKSTNVRTATRLDPEVPMLPQLLQAAGYSTAHFGKWHLGREPHSPLERGFDVDLPHWWGPGPKTGYLAPWGYPNPNFEEGKPGEHIEDRMATEAVTWLRNRDPEKPFFLNYWQFSVHAPFGAKKELVHHYRQKLGNTVEGLSAPAVRNRQLSAHQPETNLPQHSSTYAAMVHSLDDAVGSLLDAVDEAGIADDTVIIFYSDNGGNIHCGLEETAAAGSKYITPVTSNHPLRGGKGGIHEGGVRVPAIVVWPGVTQAGSRSDVLIQSCDLYPTILSMLSLTRPKAHVIDGVNFARALRGEEMKRPPIFTLAPGHGATPHWLPPSMSVHEGDWKLIRTFHYGTDGSHQYRLYNLRQDIGESRNLALQNPEKVRQLDRLIEAYVEDAGVVVPLPNPSFDPKRFDPETVGVQPGGLKMPPNFRGKPLARQPAGASQRHTTALQYAMQGWIVRNATVKIDRESLQITPDGRQPLLANAKLRANGPAKLRLRIRTQKAATGHLQWRTDSQESFPETGQQETFKISEGDWKELSIPINVQKRLIHLRLSFPGLRQPIKIDWIEITPTPPGTNESSRWDFGQANSGIPAKKR